MLENVVYFPIMIGFVQLCLASSNHDWIIILHITLYKILILFHIHIHSLYRSMVTQLEPLSEAKSNTAAIIHWVFASVFDTASQQASFLVKLHMMAQSRVVLFNISRKHKSTQNDEQADNSFRPQTSISLSICTVDELVCD